MSEHLSIDKVTVDVCVYDVVMDLFDFDFSARVDNDGDIRINLYEPSFKDNAIEYIKSNFDPDEIKEMFGLED